MRTARSVACRVNAARNLTSLEPARRHGVIRQAARTCRSPLLVAAGMMLVVTLVGCTEKSGGLASSGAGPAFCKDLGEQAGLRKAVIDSVTGQADAADSAVFRAVASHLRSVAPAATGDLSIQLTNAGQVLDSLADGGRPSDRLISTLVDVFTRFDQQLRTTCQYQASGTGVPMDSFVPASAELVAAVLPAWIGPDRGLCHMDEGRGQVPAKFPLSACFDGDYLYMVNDLSVPVMVYADGAGAPATSGTRGAPMPSQILTMAFLHEFNLFPPKFQGRFHVGANAAKVRVELASTKINEVYVVTKAIWSYVPGLSASRAIVDLVIELVDVGDQYIRCLKRNGFWGDIGCVALVGRNILFALGRASLSGVKGIAEAVLNLFDSASWLADDLGSVAQLRSTTSFAIAARAPSNGTGGTGSPGGGTGGSGGTGGTGGSGGSGGGTNPAPPPKPTLSNFAATVQGPGQVQVTFTVGWQTGRDPVTCHFFIDGTERFTAQCGTSSSKTFTGLAAGVHQFYASVTDQHGISSDPSPVLSRDVPGQPAPNPTIALTRGAPATYGYWYSVTLSGFAPGSSVTVTCRDSVDPGGFWNQTFTIDGSGHASDSTLCYSGDHPDHWVTGGGAESNHLTW